MREIQILCEQYGKISLRDLAFNNIGRANSMRAAGLVTNAKSNRNLHSANSHFKQFVDFQQSFITGKVDDKINKNKVKKSLENRFGIKKNGVKH